jgi:hypothetical protein
MKRGVDITLWIVGISIPMVTLIVGIIILSNKSQPPPDPTLGMGQTIKPVLSRDVAACGAEAVACDPTDPATCAACDGFVCTTVGTNDTNYDIEGSYCLPPQPQNACAQVPTNNSDRMQGVQRWVGWAGVNVQNWQCDCPYPQYYPMDTTGTSVDMGACKRSSALCRNGSWTYPCVRKLDENGEVIPDQCAELSAEEEARLAGSDPLQNGMCACDNVACGGDSDCAGQCVDGVCKNQRLSMNAVTGLPECVPDTCLGNWEILPIAPYIYGHCVD